MRTSPPFDDQTERRLIDEFVLNVGFLACAKEKLSRTLRGFCEQYRVLSRRESFLGEIHSCRWLSVWKRQELPMNRSLDDLKSTLVTVRRWCAFLFETRVISDNAFFYLDVPRFVQGLQAPPHLVCNLQRLIEQYGARKVSWGYKASSVKVYCRPLHDFNLFFNTQNAWASDWGTLQKEALVTNWIRHRSRQTMEKNFGVELRLLGDFFQFLQDRGLLKLNRVRMLYQKYPRQGWRGLGRIGKAKNVQAALDNLRSSQPRFQGPCGHLMVEFIRFKRNLGAKYEFEEGTLASLDNALAQAQVRSVEDVSPLHIQQWLQALPAINEWTRNTKRRVAGRFFDDAQRRGFVSNNPAHVPCRVPRRKTLRPFVFTQSQVAQILLHARGLPDTGFFPHRGHTYELVFATFYSLGLRAGELCRICFEDLDFEQGLLFVRPSKFYKSRILPLGPKHTERLRQFKALRCEAAQTMDHDAPFFVTRHGRPMRRQGIARVLKKITEETLKLKPQCDQRGPCPHSFRHAFAVHRLLRWYREGANVQAKLPLLSAFMGHADIASTAVYLREASGLLEAASIRFETHCADFFSNRRTRQ